MANFYTEFSFVIEGITADDRKWVEEYVDELENNEDDLGMSLMFGREFEGDTLLIYSDEDGNVEDVADFLEGFINERRPEAVLWFEWANTCSNPRADGFGGGCCVVSKEGQHWMNTYDFGYQKEKEILEVREL